MIANIKVSNLPGVGSYYSRKLEKLGVETVEDLIHHFPFRYEDFKSAENSSFTEGEKVNIKGTVWQIKNVRTRTGKFLTQAQVAANDQIIDIVWFNQSYLTKTIKSGTPISLSGKISMEKRPKMIAPTYEILRSGEISTAETTHTEGLVSIYPETEGLSSKWLRTKIKNLLKPYLLEANEFLPKGIIDKYKFDKISSALQNIHFPKSAQDIKSASRRLSFDELFLTQLLSTKRRQEWQAQKKAQAFKVDRKVIDSFIASLPFKLTNSQLKAIDEIIADLSRQTPTNRLLEGDVGSGKTVVAAVAALVATSNGTSVLIAAPTEILALQHYKTLNELLKSFGINVGIWTAAKKEKGQVISGTHALLSSYKSEEDVGLIIVDEQHRFGVAQRAQLFLTNTKNHAPHLLTMTATPIPRTLALTLYGDLDLSYLSEMPKGRQRISTFVVPNKKRQDAYHFIEKQVGVGRQAFIITPFVEPSESMTTVKAASVEFEKIKKIFNKKIKLDLLHGKLKSKEKEKVINDFKSGKIHVLVATPVVEVGIDVPNANLIMIESADRFGLAQLHQLRGRVGRGDHKSYCLLFTDSNAQTSTKRLKSMETIHVGAELAEIDLKMRGSGQIFGLKQSGFENFKIADLSDRELLSIANQEAKALLLEDPELKSYPSLSKKLDSISNQFSLAN